MHIPALRESAFWRIATLCILYIAQGLPFGLFSVSIPSWLATQGYTTAEVATFIGIAGLPWSFKFFAGPIMDRFSFLSMGHRRPWILLAQTGIVSSFLFLAAIYPHLSSIYAVASLGFLINFFCASQDVAVDGMAIGVLKHTERGRANAFMFGGQFVGIAGGSSGGGYLLNYFGLLETALVGAAMTFAIFLVPLLFKERAMEKRFPWSAGGVAPEIAHLKVARIRPMLGTLIAVLVVPLSVLLIVTEALSRTANGLVFAYLPTFTVQDLNWDDTLYNDWFSAGTLIAAAIGVLVSPLIDRFGASVTIACTSLAKATLLAAFALLPWMWSDASWTAFIVAFVVLGHVFAIAIISTFMRICTPAVAASQFAIYMASSNLAYALGALLLGAVGSLVSTTQLLFATALSFILVPLLFRSATRLLERDMQRASAIASS